MGGISGIAFTERDRIVEEELLLPMVRELGISSEEGDSVRSLGMAGLGARSFRKSMTGTVEISVGGERVALAFHGAVHNLKELLPVPSRYPDPLLEFLDHYLGHGLPSLLKRLRGEFVLALWDGRENALFLATDPFRVHPVFYYKDKDKFLFSSKIKGLLACPLPVHRTINPEAIVDVAGSSIVPAPNSIFREIRKMLPGHVLTYRDGALKMDRYWEVNFLPSGEKKESALAEKLRAKFLESLSGCLGVDQEKEVIGAYLSGGVDSSTVTGVMTQLLGRPVKTFSIGFDDRKYNEIRYARFAAKTFATEHHEYFVTPDDTYDALPLMTEIFDEPFANASAIPAYYCAKMARENSVEVLYAGDGGDELFAGNERYAAQRLFDYYQKIPSWIRAPVLTPAVFALADRVKFEVFVKGKKYIRRANLPYHERLTSYNFFRVVPLTDFLEDSMLEKIGRDYDPYSLFSTYYFQAPARENLDRNLYIDWHLTLADNDLVKVIHTAEAAGVTVRFPFLDKALVEFSTTVPAGIKMRGRTLRSFFKNAYADLLPMEIRKKKKHGFGLPIPDWLRTEKRLNELMHDLVSSPMAVQRGYFRKRAIEELIARHRTDTTSFYGTILWNLMVLELWHRRYWDVTR